MRWLPIAAITLILCPAALGQTVRVKDTASLRTAVQQATPGTQILMGPGDYAGLYVTDVHGADKAPISIGAADPANPPRFVAPIQFQRVSYIEFHDFAIVGASGNAIGVDDGGERETPAAHIVFRNLHITEVPGDGSNGIKLAGVDDFRIEKCSVMRWGGCAVDMVGCHRGVIEGCKFEKGGAVGVQAKGASATITIRACTFVDAGGSGVNIGQSTGIPYFRPPLDKFEEGTRYEAKNVLVERCTFLRGRAAVSFIGIDGATFRFNTIVDPEAWALRILQETNTPDFVPCRNGVFEDNLVLFKTTGWSEGGVNIGPGTAPETFRFGRNWWYCSDHPDRSKPSLPVPETLGIVGLDPQLRDPDHGDFRLKEGSPAIHVGAFGVPNPKR